MKTTIELPDEALRAAKAISASKGMSLKDFFSEALIEKLKRISDENSGQAPWMAGFGKLSHLSTETERIMADIEAEFEIIEHEDL